MLDYDQFLVKNLEFNIVVLKPQKRLFKSLLLGQTFKSPNNGRGMVYLFFLALHSYRKVITRGPQVQYPLLSAFLMCKDCFTWIYLVYSGHQLRTCTPD